MCGIIGIVGRNCVTPLLLEGLKRLEYRGYDSTGAAVQGAGDGGPRVSWAISPSWSIAILSAV